MHRVHIPRQRKRRSGVLVEQIGAPHVATQRSYELVPAARSAYALTTCAALRGVSGTACTRWPFSTGRNTGPVGVTT